MIRRWETRLSFRQCKEAWRAFGPGGAGKTAAVRYVLMAALVFWSLSSAVPAAAQATSPTKIAAGPVRSQVQTATETIALPIAIPHDLRLAREAAGDRVELPGFALGGRPGDPQLPFYRFCFLLPADVDVDRVLAGVENARWEDVAGKFDIAPAPPAATFIDGKPVVVWGDKNPALIVNGRDIAIYSRNAVFPANPVTEKTPSQYRQWNLVYVAVCPVAYNPVEGSVRLLRSGTVVVRFARKPKPAGPEAAPALAPAQSERFWKRISPQLENAADRTVFYPLEAEQKEGRAPANPNYVIITTSNIQSGSTKLSNFVTHKSNLDYNVRVVTEAVSADDSHYLSGTNCTSRTANIRSWLQSRYSTWAVEFVLLIGDPDPTTWNANRSVPMMMCYPDPAGGTQVPSDMCFAELSGNWDRDGDTRRGEWSDDFGSGGIDKNAEVAVGRIPYYGTMADLDGILQKIINYEGATTAPWRLKMLIPAAVSNFAPEDHNQDGDALDAGEFSSISQRTFGADWGESVKSLATGNGYSAYTLYEKTGCYGDGSAFSLTACSATLNSANVVAEWGNQYGFVSWWGHGSQTGASRLYWNVDSAPPIPGDLMTQNPPETVWADFFNTGNCASLPNNAPSFVVQVSCDNGYPENSGNLGYSLLRAGAIGTVSASRVSWYAVGSWLITYAWSVGDNASYGYYLPSRMIVSSDEIGHALNYCRANFGTVWGYQSWMNCLDFNIYGDPAGTQNILDTAPSVVSSVRADQNPTSASTVRFTVTFSESVTGVGTSDFGLTSSGITGASVSSVSAGTSTYTVTVYTGSGNGTIRLDVIDDDTIVDVNTNPLGGAGAGNGNFTAGETYAIDKTSPTVTVNQAFGQADPTNVLPIVFAVTFSENVVGFGPADVSMGGTAAAPIFNIAGGGALYSINVLGVGSDGTVVPTINAGGARDAAGNPNAASTSLDNSVTFDGTNPAATAITRLDASPSSAASVRFEVQFSESVTGVGSADFAIDASGASGASVTSVTGSGTSRTVTVSTGSGDGSLSIDLIDDDSIRDQVNNRLGGTGTGNGNFTTGETYQIDKTAPMCSMPTDAGNFSTTTLVTFLWPAASDGPGGCGIACYQVQVGTTAGGSDVCDLDVGLSTSHTLAGGEGQRLFARVRATDRAGNVGNFSANSDGILIDTIAPATTVTGPTGTLTQPIIQVQFSATETGSGLADVRLFYRKNGWGGFRPYGDAVTTSPIVFNTTLLGNGAYELYTMGRDNAGNRESAPAPADVTVTINAVTGAQRWWLY